MDDWWAMKEWSGDDLDLGQKLRNGHGENGGTLRRGDGERVKDGGVPG